jgi:hypothetical protein
MSLTSLSVMGRYVGEGSLWHLMKLGDSGG